MLEINQQQFVDEIQHTGFTIHRNIFEKGMIEELRNFATTKWHGWNEVMKMENPLTDVDWAYYWTKNVTHPHITAIQEKIAPCADAAFGEGNWVWYVQDFIVLQPGMNFLRPHIDTPYRFKEWRYAEELLGLQFMVMMQDFTPENGATGYVPGTHKYIQDGYHMRDSPESWKIFFADNYKQYTADAGSFVCWHPRLLHSTMPNRSSEVRHALLLHASEKTTARRLNLIDPQHNSTLRTT